MSYVLLLMFIMFYIFAAVGSVLFDQINPVLWGDIAVSMLTLFRVVTFEDWTDVMYETMAVYGFSWIYYVTFIFFSAFVFLNMMIGIVVEVLDEEHTKMMAEEVAEEKAEEEDKQVKLQQEVALLHQKIDLLLADKNLEKRD